MAKKPTTKRRSTVTPGNDDIFAAYSRHADDMNASAPPPDVETKPKGEPTMADLLQQMGAMSERMEELQRVNQALQQPVHQTPTVERPPEVKLDGLPDPVSDPQGYASELQKRVIANVAALSEYDRKVAAASQGNSDRWDNLYTDFQAQHEDYAADTDKLEVATKKALKSAVARGLDQERYMLGNRETFFTDIRKHYDKLFGAPGDGEEADTTPDEARSTSIFGGLESGGKSGKRPEPDPGAGDMMKELQAEQRKMGLF